MDRYAWKAKIFPGKLEEYQKRHDEIWPEMKQMFREAGIRNYTIWSVGDELFGYYECDSVEYAGIVQRDSEVSRRWKEFMAEIMTMENDPETGAQPRLKQVFLFDES